MCCTLSIVTSPCMRLRYWVGATVTGTLQLAEEQLVVGTSANVERIVLLLVSTVSHVCHHTITSHSGVETLTMTTPVSHVGAIVMLQRARIMCHLTSTLETSGGVGEGCVKGAGVTLLVPTVKAVWRDITGRLTGPWSGTVLPASALLMVQPTTQLLVTRSEIVLFKPLRLLNRFSVMATHQQNRASRVIALKKKTHV